MRKKYTEPVIEFQDFSLRNRICTDCAMELSFAEFSCPVLIPEWGERIFTESNTSCDYSGDGDEVCYHVPTVENNVFGS